jgi:hypothetical protein
MKREQLWIGGGALAALAVWLIWRDDLSMQRERGGAGRHLESSAVRGPALDAALGQVTPDDLLHFGPVFQPTSWRPHRVYYPATPGQELERLQRGSPGACVVAVPRELRGWIFAPPAEVDY